MSAKPLSAEPLAANAVAEHDPVDAAFENAPVIELGNLEEVARLLREARAEVEAGADLIAHAEVMRGARVNASASEAMATPLGTSRDARPARGPALA